MSNKYINYEKYKNVKRYYNIIVTLTDQQKQMIDEFLFYNYKALIYEYYSTQDKVDEFVVSLNNAGLEITNQELNQLFPYYKEYNRLIKTMSSLGNGNINNDIEIFFKDFHYYNVFHRYSFYRYLCDNYNEKFSERHVYNLLKENAPSGADLTEFY